MISYISSWFDSGDLPDDAVCTNFERARTLLHTAFNESNAEHEGTLERIWHAYYGASEPAERVSQRWKTLGFQRDDPRSDVRGGGLLCLQQLLYFLTHSAHGSVARSQIETQRPRAETNYPWAAVGINLTRLVCDTLLISTNQYRTTKRTYYALFRDPGALDELYVQVFLVFDAVWRRKRATYMQTSTILALVKERLAGALQRSPASFAQLVQMLNENLDMVV